jgi:peptidoglycan/xylan/chitin deacetylase (PgdA/CDA1 family)
MTERGIGRSAILVGLLVLAVLVGGRITGTLHTRQTGHLATGKHGGGVTTGRQVSQPKTRPAATPSSPPNSPKSTPSGGHAGWGSKGPGPSRSGELRVLRTVRAGAVALSFDDGPSPDWTPKVLDLLREQGIKATFCLIGTQVRAHPELVARIVREGHTLCDHSWQHDLNLGSRPEAEIRSDLTRTNAEIRRAVPGARIGYFRQPGGKWTPEEVKVAKELGMAPLGWAVDPQDWTRPGAKKIIERVTDNTQKGSIVLMHDGGGDRGQTLEACQTLIPRLKERFRLVSLR